MSSKDFSKDVRSFKLSFFSTYVNKFGLTKSLLNKYTILAFVFES